MKWYENAFFYHVFPLGFCSKEETTGLSPLTDYILQKKQELGINAIFLGPVFYAENHGYDTIDLHNIDPRLASNEEFSQMIQIWHDHGLKIIIDAVFNHTGRAFFAFQDILKLKEQSSYKDWYSGVKFRNNSGWDITYDSWNGHTNLPKLNLKNPEVTDYLLQTVQYWINNFKIDGLRLDAADCLDSDFLKMLHSHCLNIDPEFLLLGEIIHGDYRNWANSEMLHCVTNYEMYKGLWSSHNDHNYFEIAWTLNRQFGEQGLYRNQRHYNFVDNHDVTRVISQLTKPEHIFPLYILLFTVPGMPSIYYGSEIGTQGIKQERDDWNLRPSRNQLSMHHSWSKDLIRVIQQLSMIYQTQPAIRFGGYQEIFVGHQLMAFRRDFKEDSIIVLLNSHDAVNSLTLPINKIKTGPYEDLLNQGEIFHFNSEQSRIKIYPNWGRILKLKN